MKVAVTVLLAGVAIGLAGVTIVTQPGLVRVALVVGLIGTVLLIFLRKPRLALILLFCFLPLLALARRLLLPVAGWTTWDALLVVAPVVCVILAHRLIVMERRPLAKDPFSKLLVGLLVLALLESVNPQGGSLTAGLTGVLFVAAPLGWFFIGRELADRGLVNALLIATVAMGCLAAAYGLWQTAVGFPSWDQAWIAINLANGYVSLHLADTIRPFGTLSNSTEYATFLGVAFVIAFVAVLHGRWLAILALPLLGYALFLASVRGTVTLALIAMAVALGLRTGSIRVTLLSTSSFALLAAATIVFFGPQLTQSAASSGNLFVAHQVAGLMNPLDPQQSTYAAHQDMVLNGVALGFVHPLGLGLAAVNPHVGRWGAATSAGTEVDVSNIFVSLGPLGGVLFSVLILITLWRSGRLALSHDGVTEGAVAGVLIVTLGQWLNGSSYAVAPLVWIFVGWVIATSLRRRAADRVGATRSRVLDGPAWPATPQPGWDMPLAGAGRWS